MAKALRTDLNYGHFGQAVYSTDDSTWKFGRITAGRGGFEQLGPSRTVLAPAARLGSPSISAGAGQNLEDAQQATKITGRDNPVLAPSLPLLPELALVSAAVVSTAERYDPAIGERLAFGSITSKGHTKNPKQVVALAAGEAGNILRLIMLEKERQGWDHNQIWKDADRSLFIQGVSVTDGESGYWVEDAAPIRQICFAQADETSTFLAVRLPTRTILFRPFHIDLPKTTLSCRSYGLPPSRIDARPVTSIPIEKTGGVPHSDVAFNPDYQRQVGVIDQKGDWSVWDIEGGHKNGTKSSVSCTVIGAISPTTDQLNDTDGKKSIPQEDGWARILWIGNVNTILVCNRRVLQIHDIKGGQSTMLSSLDVVPPASADWILDVKRHPTNRNQFFVITSTRLSLMAVTYTSDVVKNDMDGPAASVISSWTHFRGPEDTTLQLCVRPLSEQEITVLVSSRLNTLVNMFRFHEPETEQTPPFSSLDPTLVRLSQNMFESRLGTGAVVALQLDKLQYVEDIRIEGTGPGHIYRAQNVTFYCLYVQLSDLSIHRALFYDRGPREEDQEAAITIDPPSWQTIISPSGRRIASSELVGSDDEFVVPDFEERRSVPKLRTTPRLSQQPPHGGLRPAQGDTSWERRQNMLYHFLYGVLIQDEQQQHLETKEALAVVNEVEEVLVESFGQGQMSAGTLVELGYSGNNVADIDEASSKLDDLLSFQGWPSRLELHRIATVRVLHLESNDGEELTIASLYDTLLARWIAPLPTNISVHVRQTKERLSRRLAAGVVFASVRIRHPARPMLPTETPPLLRTVPSQDSAISLPILPSRSGDGVSIAQSSAASTSWSQPTSVVIADTASSLPSNTQLGSIQAMPIDSLRRLSQHLQVNESSRPFPQRTGRVLMHWQHGADPSNYDWMKTADVVDDEMYVADEFSQKEKEKAKRKADRLRKRQKREQELGIKMGESQPIFGLGDGLLRETGFRSSPAPAVGMSSQVPSQSQLQGMGGVPTMFGNVQSQVEPGRHGGRPLVKKKKAKARVSGF